MIMTLISLFMMNTISHAALPPSADRMRQFKTVLDSDQVYGVLAGRFMNSVTAQVSPYTGVVTYAVKTDDDCRFHVVIDAVAKETSGNIPPAPGPTDYKVAKVSKLICPKK